MAIHSITRGGHRAATRSELETWPASLPIDTLIGVFDDREPAIRLYAQLLAEQPSPRVWLATGASGAARMRDAWSRRSFLRRLLSSLSDEDSVLTNLTRQVQAGRTVLAASDRDSTVLPGATQTVRFGRWLIR